MFTIATLILIGLLAGIYFTLGKHLKAKITEVERSNLYKRYYGDNKHTTVVDDVVMKAILKRKKITKSKYKKRFV